MNKDLVIYYSRKGSNKYLAGKISESLGCDLETIRPRVDLFILHLLKINFGIWPIRRDLAQYDRIILCGPIWMGNFVQPLRSFVNKYFDSIHELIFVSCCGSSYEKKDEKFGHGLVFKEVKELLKGKCSMCQAFPVTMVLPENLKEDAETFMNTRLNDENFNGSISLKFNDFISQLTKY